jgi:uncharacterized protein (TIGR00266 family)
MQYKIEGGQLPVVIVELEENEQIITEGGGMSWMTENMQMETKGGGLGKVFGRMLSGEALFQNIYTAKQGPGMIALASSLPGTIMAVKIEKDKPFIVQKKAFLGAESSVELSIFFQRKLGAGFFGGEGFIMQKLTGQGVAFVELDGYVKAYELEAGEKMIIDTGYLAAMDSTVTMDIKTVGNLKDMVFGGEGLFHTVVTGPGKVYLQSMPASKFMSPVQHK